MDVLDALASPAGAYARRRPAMVAGHYRRTMSMAKASKTTPRYSKKRTSKAKPTKTAARADSKQAKLIEMLRRTEGATLDEIVKKLEWQPHTVRGAIAGALKKKLKLDVQSDKVEGRGRVYRIAS